MAAVSVGKNERLIENNLFNFSFVITWREKMLLKLLKQVGSMIKMLRLSQVNNFFSVKFGMHNLQNRSN